MKCTSVRALIKLPCVPTLHIHSIEGDIYTADCVLHSGERVRICRNDGRALSGHSLDDIHSLLAGIRFNDTWLIQRVAYDEMIGTPTWSGPQRIRLNWATQAE